MKTTISAERLTLIEDRRSNNLQLAAIALFTLLVVPLAFVAGAAEENSTLPAIILSPMILIVIVVLSLSRTLFKPKAQFTFDRQSDRFLRGSTVVAPLSAIQCVVVEADPAKAGYGHRLTVLTRELETELDTALGGLVEIAALEKLANQVAAYLNVRVVHREAQG